MTHFLRGGGVALLAFSLACPAAHTSNDDIAAALAAIPDAVVSARAADGVPTFLSGDLAKVCEVPSDVAEAERALAPRLGSVLAPFRLQPSDVKLRRIQSGQDGQIHYRYRQFANGIEVVGGDLIVHVDRQGTCMPSMVALAEICRVTRRTTSHRHVRLRKSLMTVGSGDLTLDPLVLCI